MTCADFKEEIYRIIIGSSNITSAALTKNKEWNTKNVSTEQGEIVMEIVKEFHQLWDSKYVLFYDDFYENYKQKYGICCVNAPYPVPFLSFEKLR